MAQISLIHSSKMFERFLVVVLRLSCVFPNVFARLLVLMRKEEKNLRPSESIFVKGYSVYRPSPYQVDGCVLPSCEWRPTEYIIT